MGHCLRCTPCGGARNGATMHRPCRRERFTGPCRVQTCAEARRKMILPAGSAGCSTSPDQHQCVSLHGYLGLPELVRYDDASLRCTSWAASAFARALAALTPALAGAGGEATLDPTSPSLPRVPVDATVTGAGGGNAVAGDVAGGRGAATGCGSPSRALAAEYRAMRRWFSCMTGPASCSTCARLAWHATPSNSPPVRPLHPPVGIRPRHTLHYLLDTKLFPHGSQLRQHRALEQRLRALQVGDLRLQLGTLNSRNCERSAPAAQHPLPNTPCLRAFPCLQTARQPLVWRAPWSWSSAAGQRSHPASPSLRQQRQSRGLSQRKPGTISRRITVEVRLRHKQ